MPGDEILIRLKNIEQKHDKRERRETIQGLQGLGFVLMFGSLSLLSLKASAWGIWKTLIIAGLLAVGTPNITLILESIRKK